MIVLAIIVIIGLIILVQYNIIIKLKIKVEQAKSGIDIYCQQRFDLIPNLVEIVKNIVNMKKKLLIKLSS